MVSFDSSQLFPTPTVARQTQLLLAHKFGGRNRSTKKRRRKQMKKQIIDLSSLLFLSYFFSSISQGLADSSSTSDSSNNQNAASKKSSGSSTWLEALLIILGLLAVGAFSVFLFKLWQRKKREEQHARLLRLFEQDDELEVELGLRD